MRAGGGLSPNPPRPPLHLPPSLRPSVPPPPLPASVPPSLPRPPSLPFPPPRTHALIVFPAPQLMELNCDSTRLALIDLGGVLTLFDLEAGRSPPPPHPPPTHTTHTHTHTFTATGRCAPFSAHTHTTGQSLIHCRRPVSPPSPPPP